MQREWPSLSPEQLVTSESSLAFTRNYHGNLRREDYHNILESSTRKRLIDVLTLIILEQGNIRNRDSAVGTPTGYGLND
jgi:hypothetical protein